MALLTKKQSLIERDGEGKLLPVTVQLELLGEDAPEVQIIPMNRGELKKLQSLADEKGNTPENADNEIILKHCHNPKYTENELADLKGNFANAIVIAIMAVSTGMGQKEMFNKSVKGVLEKADKAEQEAFEKKD